MNTPQAPAAPDPVKTAQAQSTANKETAVAQYGLNATNQVTPTGSLTYKQIGTWSDGTPRFEATTALSPEQESLYKKYTETQGNLGDIGVSQSAKIGKILSTPFDINASRDSKIGDIQQKFLDPQFARAYESKKTELINSGVRPGSPAYKNAMMDFEDNKQRAYDRSYLDSYGAANTAALTERNQPINEISALLSNSQVSQPSFTNTPSPGVAPTDVIGAQQQALNQQNVGYQADLQQQQALMNGLFKLGSAAAGGWAMSDIDTKENIEVVGERDDGLHVIDFDYKPEFGGGKDNRGLIAQEVAQVYPEAVARVPAAGNRLAVNYDRVPRGMMALGRVA